MYRVLLILILFTISCSRTEPINHSINEVVPVIVNKPKPLRLPVDFVNYDKENLDLQNKTVLLMKKFEELGINKYLFDPRLDSNELRIDFERNTIHYSRKSTEIEFQDIMSVKLHELKTNNYD